MGFFHFLLDFYGGLMYNNKAVVKQNCAEYAVLAQLVEHILGKDEVAGSNPVNSLKPASQDAGFSF